MDEAHGLLRDWLRARDDRESETLLTRLLAEHLEPVIRRIVGLRLGRSAAEYEDVCQNALKSVLGRLVALKAGESGESMEKLSGYAAVVAFRAADEHVRVMSPAWSKVAGRVRYALRAPDFAVWQADGRDVCGLRSQEGLPPGSLREDDSAVQRALVEAAAARRNFGDVLRMLFRAANRPLPFATVVSILTAHTDMPMRTRLRAAEGEEDRCWEEVASSEPPLDVRLEQARFVQRLWLEICALPVDQRRALLLNLDGADGGDIRIFEWLGVASIRQMAGILEIPAEEFAEMWNDLPLDDLRIAKLFGIDRQRVINLRSRARKRLLTLKKNCTRQI